jgi:hypothetical protein
MVTTKGRVNGVTDADPFRSFELSLREVVVSDESVGRTRVSEIEICRGSVMSVGREIEC